MSNPGSIGEALSGLWSFISATGLPAIIAGEFSSFFYLEDHICSLRTATEKLLALRNKVQVKVAKEVNRMNIPDPQAQLWLMRVERILGENVEDDYDMLQRSPCFSPRYRLGKRITQKLQDVAELDEEGQQVKKFGQKPLPDLVEDWPLVQTFGMEHALMQLCEYFDDEEKGIIGIWGPGGVGKTTLLHVFSTELKKRGTFHVVDVEISNSEVLDVVHVEDIQRKIVDRLEVPWNSKKTVQARAKYLARALRKKMSVILLDDVRKKFSLEEIGIPMPDPENGCKLILASRDQQVCIQMGAQRNLIKRQVLEVGAAWSLFRSNLSSDTIAAIDSPDPRNMIRQCARTIVERCGGLPLALNIIGKAVAGLKDLEEWRYAMSSAHTGGIDGTDEMFHQLKYSYDALGSELKRCFLYCTLFPEYSSIKMDQLVDYWLAEDLISNDPDQGHVFIGRLVSACLLQRSDSRPKIKMHRIIRQFGLWLAPKEDKFLVRAGLGLKEAPAAEQWDERTRISLMSNDIKDISITPSCSSLQTLLLQNNLKLAELAPGFFKSMSSLRVLDLSHTSITELPECEALVSLQHLNLSNTLIRKLPKGFYLLEELQHLDLSMTTELEDTSDNCSKLYKLRVLNLFRSSYGICKVDDLNIDSLKMLGFLGITIFSVDVLRKLNMTHPLAKSTHRLHLKHCEGMQYLLVSDFNPMVHVEELCIESCDDLEGLAGDVGVLRSPGSISLGMTPHHFENLHELTINECHKLGDLTWVLRLESLEKLVVSHCHGMEHVVQEVKSGILTPGDGIEAQAGNSEEHEVQEIVEEAIDCCDKKSRESKQGPSSMTNGAEFPKLRSIMLIDLSKLVSICSARDFPDLRSIRVEDCPNLRRLPFDRNYKMEKLKQVCGSHEWWKGLDWEDREMAANLEECCFVPIDGYSQSSAACAT